MSAMTHCGHGISYDSECGQCDKVWAEGVVLPGVRRGIAELLRFYSCESLQELVLEQAKHVEKLQTKIPPMRDEQPKRIREG